MMHDPRWLVALACALLGACGGPAPPAPAPSSEVPASRADEPPVQLVLPHLTQYEAPNAVLIPGRVFPLGWSRDGLFAYVYEPPDEACGCYFFRLYVQDLKTDAIVWEHRYDSDELRPDDPAQLTSLAAVWRDRGAMLSAKLDELGIVRRDERALTAFAAGGLQATVRSEGVGDDSPMGFAYLTRYAIELTGAQGTQTIGRRETPDLGPLEVTALGYLPSPHAPLAAVLIEETWRGYEGPPSVAQLRFAGADLGAAGQRR